MNDRSNRTIENVLRILRPVLEEKGIIGTSIKASELAKICRNHEKRLPPRGYRALQIAEELQEIGRGGLFVLDDLEIQVYDEIDEDTRRRSPRIEFQRRVSLEQQYLNSLKQEHDSLRTTAGTVGSNP